MSCCFVIGYYRISKKKPPTKFPFCREIGGCRYANHSQRARVQKEVHVRAAPRHYCVAAPSGPAGVAFVFASPTMRVGRRSLLASWRRRSGLLVVAVGC
jgi:hypothetical protein